MRIDRIRALGVAVQSASESATGAVQAMQGLEGGARQIREVHDELTSLGDTLANLPQQPAGLGSTSGNETPTAGGAKSPRLIAAYSTAELEALARKVKEQIDKITARSR